MSLLTITSKHLTGCEVLLKYQCCKFIVKLTAMLNSWFEQCLVKGGAWLRRFDDVTGVEKSCVAKAKKRKKVKEKSCIIIIATLYAFPPNMECMEVCEV